jgi:hypothetical protein
MSTTPPTIRERATARSLAALYRIHGRAGVILPSGGDPADAFPVTVIMRETENVEGLDGAQIEAVLRGFSALVRTSDLPAETALTGATLTVDPAFSGRVSFHLDTEPHAHGREGLQRLLKLSARPEGQSEDFA